MPPALTHDGLAKTERSIHHGDELDRSSTARVCRPGETGGRKDVEFRR